WTPWGTGFEAKRPGSLEVTSSKLADVALIAPVSLQPARYEISAVIRGIVEGHAHVSLHGVKKLIDIPAGDYSNSATFSTILDVDAPGFQGQLAFGLGGWAQGAGQVTLESLHLVPQPSFKHCEPANAHE